MKILSINSGSSSIKSTLFDINKKTEKIATLHIDGIGLKKCKFTLKSKTKNIGQSIEINNHEEGIKFIFENLIKTKTIEKYSEIDAIGHRVVHGGKKYTKSVKIDANVIKEIEKISPLAPLHNPPNLLGIKACKKMLPKTKQVAVFDTAFHQTIPEKAYLYGLPYNLYKKNNIRKYGFHGISHKYITQETSKKLKKKNLKIISCHLGNGSSITASINGKSVDTSMGLTPLEGVIMGTRSGSFDPSIIFFLKENLKMDIKKINKLINEESGLKGISEISSDMRNIYEEYLKKNERAILTIELLSYQIAKYIGAYAAAMNGIDAIVFTGGMGEKAFYVREKTCEYIKFLGANLDKNKNKNSEEVISDKKSKVKILVIKTNEELQIAEETKALIKG